MRTITASWTNSGNRLWVFSFLVCNYSDMYFIRIDEIITHGLGVLAQVYSRHCERLPVVSAAHGCNEIDDHSRKAARSFIDFFFVTKSLGFFAEPPIIVNHE